MGVAVADFDADGKLDLAVTGIPNFGIFAGVVVMLGRGDGTFAARSYIGVPSRHAVPSSRETSTATARWTWH